jgi:XTP/dITP diphosphohydrolase
MAGEILFASNNPGKQQEVSRFAEEYGITVRSPKELGIDMDVEETGTTYEENAILKLDAHREAIDDPEMIVLADDSGIAIDALGGEPGVYSRRWAGYEMTDEEIIEYCLDKMGGIEPERRTARFIATMAFATKHMEPRIANSQIAGQILQAPEEGGRLEGFPFRALFYVPEAGKMLYEIHDISAEERGGHLTHREKALKKVFDTLQENHP